MGDMLSQEEIDALLKGAPQNTNDSNEAALDENEKDALGEIGNISMGTAATTLFTLLGQKVTITTPQISVITMEELASQYPVPFVAVEVKYREGLKGMNLLVLKEKDVKVITDLMMGGDGSSDMGELTELHLSAISEAMNQMVASSATSLAEMFQKRIDIFPPKAFSFSFSNSQIDIKDLDPKDKVVKTSFKMVVGDILNSEIMQIIPVGFAKELVGNLFGENQDDNTKNDGYSEKKTVESSNIDMEKNNSYETDNSTPYSNNSIENTEKKEVKVQPVQFPNLDDTPSLGQKEDIGLIRDIPLKVTVELGRTTKKISEILEFSPGTVVELDRLVGEPLDILVNGQFIAKGEVVVIDENYGIRVTDIINPTKRINKVK